MGKKSHCFACPGLTASEEHLLTKDRIGMKHQSEKQDLLDTPVQEQIQQQASVLTCTTL